MIIKYKFKTNIKIKILTNLYKIVLIGVLLGTTYSNASCWRLCFGEQINMVPTQEQEVNSSNEMINEIFNETPSHQIIIPRATKELQEICLETFVESYIQYTSGKLKDYIGYLLSNNSFSMEEYIHTQNKEMNYIFKCALKGTFVTKYKKEYVNPDFDKLLFDNSSSENKSDKLYLDIHHSGDVFYSEAVINKIEILKYQ